MRRRNLEGGIAKPRAQVRKTQHIASVRGGERGAGDFCRIATTPTPGETAAPFLSDAGVELIGRCDKHVEVKTAYVMPTRQQVEDQLFQNQIATLARRYLRDLKREANIQVRDNSKPDALIR